MIAQKELFSDDDDNDDDDDDDDERLCVHLEPEYDVYFLSLLLYDAVSTTIT
jgi:hypothetical protein